MPERSTPGPGRPVPDAIDAPFAVDFVHRLRFAVDVLDRPTGVLAEVLEGDDGEAPRAIVAIDRGLHEAWPGLDDRVVRFAAAARVELAAPPLIVTGGEAAKNSDEVFRQTLAAIDRAGLDRRSYVIALGGGAVLDAVGFAAATAHRGVRLVRLPTTTLSQGDGGLGVKNGINAFGKKNFLGTFTPPWAVINDWMFTSTLPAAAWRGGFSEAVKVALIKDRDLFEQIDAGAERIAARDEEIAEPIIRRSAQLHLQHITDGGDPFELTESRPLDFGHWAAHKLEQTSGFAVPHGDAVAIGVAMDTLYSARSGWLDEADADAVLECLERLGFTLHHPALAPTSRLLDGLEEFREHLGGRLTITMLRGIGQAVDVHEMDGARVESVIEELGERAGY